ncbi:hypothetical protein QBC47DRAFT_403973 [Echria macrotheca]|uniref:Uncharacterized protein n=1 Tax=Echria macrotheca TaxID=438768 RepID=A0AAJ0F9Z2_9PEZI|nr:hypothetical protein QBC47DRAFT_403973 [Echria macrotheca]
MLLLLTHLLSDSGATLPRPWRRERGAGESEFAYTPKTLAHRKHADTTEHILRATKLHLNHQHLGADFSRQRETVHDLVLGGMQRYGTDAVPCDEAWRDSEAKLEADRLADDMHLAGTLLFESGNCGYMGGHNDLVSASETIMWCLTICEHDFEVALLEHYPGKCDQSCLLAAQGALQSRIYVVNRRRATNGERLQLCHALVDYIMANVGFMIVEKSNFAE